MVGWLPILCFFLLHWRSKLKISRASAGCQQPTPVILATQEGDIRRILVQSQPGVRVGGLHETLSQKKKKKRQKELVEWLKVQALNSNPSTGKKKNSSASRVAQVVEYLPSKCEALNSSPSTT
jgi:hypothetical protein